MAAIRKACAGPQPLNEMEALTRSYARYSRSAGGLGSVLGGVLCLASYFTGALLPSTSAVSGALVAMPFVWLATKQWLAHSYYQRFGRVEEQETRTDRWTHRFCVAVSLAVALGITVFGLIGLGNLPAGALAGLTGYLALLWLLPLAAWRWMRSATDFIVGVFLICQAALACVGQAYPMIGVSPDASWHLTLTALMFPVVAVFMIAAGIRDHRRFQSLRQRLEELRRA